MQDLDKFKNEMNLSGKNVYVGHRYVPKIMGEWDNSQIYEPLTIVQYQGNSFTSRQYVPIGIEITNEEYWASTGNYNAQVEQYRQDVVNLGNELNTVNEEVVNARNGEATLSDRLDKDYQNALELLEHSITNVKQFGALGDGLTDDTDSINNAINHVSSLGGGVVRIPYSNTPYMIDAVKSIQLKDNITLQIDGYTTLKCIPNNQQTYNIIDVRDVSNVSIVSDGLAYIVGDRDDHLDSKGEWGAGVGVRNVENIYMKNIVSMDTWGDGFYLSNVVNGVFDDLKSDRARRNGFSLISGENLCFNRPISNNTGGTNPQSGFDIEPNNVEELLKNIVINQPYFKDNARYGLVCYFGMLNGSTNKVDVIVNQPKLINNTLQIMGLESVIDGLLVVNDLEVMNAPSHGVNILSKHFDSVKIELNNPRIIDFGTMNEVNNTYSSGINLENVTDFVSGKTGGLTINNPFIKSKHVMCRGIRFADININKKTVVDTEIINPKIEVDGNKLHVVSNYDNTFNIKDTNSLQKKILSTSYVHSNTLNDINIEMINDANTNLFLDPDNLKISENLIQRIIRKGDGDFDIKFRDRLNELTFKPVIVYGLADTTITNIRLNGNYGILELIKVGANEFIVNKMIGDWEGYTV